MEISALQCNIACSHRSIFSYKFHIIYIAIEIKLTDINEDQMYSDYFYLRVPMISASEGIVI